MKSQKSNAIVIVYDRECPFCANYVAMMRLKTIFTSVELVDARESNNEHVKDVKQRGYDLNKGMLVIVKGDYYYGDEAVWILSKFTEREGLILHINALLFKSKTVTGLLYPIMRFVRRVTLLVLGKKLI